MERSLNSFITLKLHEYGWYPKDHDDKELRCAIISNLLEPHLIHSSGPIPAILVKEATQIAVAEVLCTNLIDTPPNKEKLLSFTRSLVEQYHGLSFHQSIWNGALNLDDFMGNGGAPSPDTLTIPQIGRNLSFFSIPAEIRVMIYKEHLISPQGSVVRSFTPPPLLQANRMIRDEAIPIFYGKNHFEITVKRTPEYERLAGDKPSPSVDMYMWHRFLHMWEVFNQNGSNCLHYVERITVIYQLSLFTGLACGKNPFDKRIGFRLSSKPFEEDADEDYEMNSDPSDSGDSDDDSDDDSEVDPMELHAELVALLIGHDNEYIGYQTSNENHEQSPEKDFDPVGVFELERGSSEWASGSFRDTQHFLFDRVGRCGKPSF